MLTSRGYYIKKKDADENSIRKDLYVCPIVDCVTVVQRYKVFRESPESFILPRFYGIQKHGDNSKISKGIEIINTKFNGALRSATNQPEAVEKTLAHLRTHKGGILSLPTGYGKTTVALYILSQLKQRTIIFVHKEFLMNQWIEKIEQFLPEMKIGKIQGTVVDTVGKDVVIAMLQSVCMKDYQKDTFEGFGFTIIDETHHICTRTFSKIFFRLNTFYVLGLSATLERKDGLTKVIHWFIGDVCYSIVRTNQTHVTVQKIKYKNEIYIDDFPVNRMKKPSIVEAISILVNLEDRNTTIIKHILKCCQMNRKILV